MDPEQVNKDVAALRELYQDFLQVYNERKTRLFQVDEDLAFCERMLTKSIKDHYSRKYI